MRLDPFEKPSGSLAEKYIDEVTIIDAVPAYEEAGVNIGAPVETVSPLGYEVGPMSVVFLSIGRMIGTGVFTTPGAILKGVGSVGLSLIFWVIGYIFAGASLAVYLEYSTYFPHRSGAEVAYLEKAYPRPKFFLPTIFAVQSVLLAFSSSNAIILAEYLLVAGGAAPTTWRVRGLAVGVYTFLLIVCALSTKWSLRLSNVLGVVKVASLVFVAITGLAVLGGHTRVEDPHANFRNPFEGTSSNGNGLATALVKVNFAYSGFENAFNLMNEVKNPVKVMKRYAPLSLTIVFVLYFLANIAYFAAVPREKIQTSNQLTAALFFDAVFGNSSSVRALGALVAISAIGNLVSIIIGTARVIRESGRQGVLPYPKFWVSTRPFNTPLGPYLVKWILTTVVIIAPPAGDAFNFIVDLQSYPANIFAFLLTSGIWLVRKRRERIGAPRTEFRVWNAVLVFGLAVNVYLLILPWVPPQGGVDKGDVSFFYATYCIVGLAILAICGLSYVLWIQLLPKWRGYQLRQVTERFDDGAQANKLIRVPDAQVEEWDAAHDEHGNLKPVT